MSNLQHVGLHLDSGLHETFTSCISDCRRMPHASVAYLTVGQRNALI